MNGLFKKKTPNQKNKTKAQTIHNYIWCDYMSKVLEYMLSKSGLDLIPW